MVQLNFENHNPENAPEQVESRVLIKISDNGINETHVISSYRNLLIALATAERSLKNSKSKTFSICISRLIYPIDWFSPKIAQKAGELIRGLASVVKINLYSVAWYSRRMQIQFTPFITEVGPCLNKVQCGIDDLQKFQGCRIVTVHILEKIDLYERKKTFWYVQPLFLIKATNYFCEQSLYIHQFYRSGFPVQPEAKTLRCAVDFAEYPEDLYENIFQEISDTLPNLKELELNSRVVSGNSSTFNPSFKMIQYRQRLILTHIKQIQIASSLPIKVNVQFVTECDDCDDFAQTSTTQLLNSIEHSTTRWDETKKKLTHITGNVTLILTFKLEYYLNDSSDE